MKRYGMTQMLLDITALAILWCASIFFVGVLAAAAWALLKFGWGVVF
jgi:hypothetical protein